MFLKSKLREGQFNMLSLNVGTVFENPDSVICELLSII
jgi:hypothetical protein